MSTTRRPGRVRMVGTCYVCGRGAWAFYVRDVATTYLGKGVVRDLNGIRHGGCSPFKRPGPRVTPAHA